jgi:hypothetical protein
MMYSCLYIDWNSQRHENFFANAALSHCTGDFSCGPETAGQDSALHREAAIRKVPHGHLHTPTRFDFALCLLDQPGASKDAGEFEGPNHNHETGLRAERELHSGLPGEGRHKVQIEGNVHIWPAS